MKIFIPILGMTFALCLLACGDDDDESKNEELGSDAATDNDASSNEDKDAGTVDTSVMDGDVEGDGATNGPPVQPPREPRTFTEDELLPLADPGEPDIDETCDKPVNEEDCDKTRTPFVFVHGTVGSGNNLASVFQRFASNGYCSSYMKSIDYNSIDFTNGGNEMIAAMDEIIEQLREETGFDKVDLAGHSQGSGHASRYAAANPDKIRRYVHLAGGCPGTVRGSEINEDNPGEDPGGVPTLTLSSIGDMPVEKCGTTANFCHQNGYIDHFAVASSIESFVEMYKFLNDGEEPEYTTVQCEDKIILEGRAITFGDSRNVVGGKIEVYALGDEPWERGDPVASFDVGADGWVGPFEVERGVAYEFKMIPPEDKPDMPLRYTYMTPFARSDRWIRFLYRSEDPMATATNSQVEFSDDHAALVVFMKRGGFHYGAHEVEVDGFPMLNEDNAPTPATNVGYYLYDANSDGVSDGGSVITGTFVNSSDIYMPADEPAFINVTFGAQTIKVPNWPSGGGVLSLVNLE